MSQKGSSMASDNPEFKYKKALLEIQKIHNANKELKRQSQQMKNQYERQINQLNESYGHLEKECFNLKQEKTDLEKYYEELTFSHSDLQESINNLKREVKYLNDALNDQSEQLKKVDALKSQKGLSTLITSYQDRQLSYRKDISRLEQMNKSLKSNFDALEADLNEERRQRFKLEDLNNNLKMEIAKYREHNNILLTKNEHIVASLLNKNTEGKQKFREAQSMLYELSRQLEMVKNTRIEQQTTNRATVSIENYEVVLNEKAKLENELSKMRQKIQQFDFKSRMSFEMEEKMKRAEIRSEQLQEECNMLKGRLIVMETKDVMEGEADFGDLKDLEERVLSTAAQNDPLVTIKNGSDSSHFQLMKTYIIDLKDKLAKAIVGRKEFEKKYRSLKEKLTEKAEKSISFEEQNKLLKGKIEGYERLTQRLQYELQKSIEVHEEEISKMKNVTNNIITKKTEEVKVANAYVRAQLDLEMDKFQKTEKGLRQEVDTLKLELSTERIKNGQLQEKYNQASQFLVIYEKKFKDVTSSTQEVEQHNEALLENAAKYEQLYRQQRSKNQVLLGQKNTLTSRVTQLSEDLQRKSNLLEDISSRHTAVEEEAKRSKLELTQVRAELDNVQGILKMSKKQFEDKSRVAMLDISRTQTSYYNSLQQNFNQERQKNRQLEAQIQSLKLRLQRITIASQKVPQLEDQLSSKVDELNDFKRKAILTEKQISVQESEIRQIKNEFDILRRQNNTLKAKLLENGHELRRSYETKDIDSKKAIQKINEELSSALAELREERRINSRMQSDIQGHRAEVQRLATMLQQSKNKELALFEEVGQLKNACEAISDETDRLKSEIRFKNNTIEGLNNDINSVQERLYKLSQETSEVKIKKEESENDLADLKREINSLKVYMTELESFGSAKAASGSWEEQRQRDNVSNFVQRVKKIVKKSELNTQAFTTDFAASYNATPSYVPDYLKSYHEPLYGGYATTFKGSEGDARVTDSPITETYNTFGSGLPFKYGDYN